MVLTYHSTLPNLITYVACIFLPLVGLQLFPDCTVIIVYMCTMVKAITMNLECHAISLAV